jgi:hypothetical protein
MVDYLYVSMVIKRAISLIFLLVLMYLPLFGGAGRPSDGFLSFILLMGFLLGILGVLHLIERLKRWIANLLEGLY